MATCKRCGKPARLMSVLCTHCIDLPTTDIRKRGETARSLVGVHGWLALLVFGLLIAFPLFSAGRINSDFMTAEREFPALVSSPEWSAFKTATWWAFLPFAAISAYAGWQLRSTRNRSAVTQARAVLWLIGPVCTLVLQWLVPTLTLPAAEDADAAFVLPVMTSAIYATIWTAYLSRSQRVRATYTAGVNIGALSRPQASTRSGHYSSDNIEMAIVQLPQSARVAAVSSFVPFSDRFGTLKTVNPEDWDFFVTVAAVHAAMEHLRITLRNPDRIVALHHQLEPALIAWDAANGVAALRDCEQFVLRSRETIMLFDAMGFWVLWNVFKRPPTDAEAQVAPALGQLFREFSRDWNGVAA